MYVVTRDSLLYHRADRNHNRSASLRTGRLIRVLVSYHGRGTRPGLSLLTGVTRRLVRSRRVGFSLAPDILVRRVRIASVCLYRRGSCCCGDGGDSAAAAIVSEDALRLRDNGLDKIGSRELAGTRGVIFGRITTATAAFVVRDAVYL